MPEYRFILFRSFQEMLACRTLHCTEYSNLSTTYFYSLVDSRRSRWHFVLVLLIFLLNFNINDKHYTVKMMFNKRRSPNWTLGWVVQLTNGGSVRSSFTSFVTHPGGLPNVIGMMVNLFWTDVFGGYTTSQYWQPDDHVTCAYINSPWPPKLEKGICKRSCYLEGIA